MCEVGDGGIIVWMWWVDGEGTAEVSRECCDEGCGMDMWGEVGFKIPRKDVGDLRGNVVADAVELN